MLRLLLKYNGEACLKIKQVLSFQSLLQKSVKSGFLRSVLLMLVMASSQATLASAPQCRNIFNEDLQGKSSASRDVRVSGSLEKKSDKITANELSEQAAHRLSTIPEFEFIRKEAEKRGLRVWLFGGTASSYLHYVKWNLAREKSLNNLQADRFDFDYTNIFRSTQDLDIVVDGAPEQAFAFQNIISGKYPNFLGAKAAKWEVRSLRARMGRPGERGYKEALLDDEDFSHQNSDSNSLGMVEVTRSQEPVVRDLRHWDSIDSPFLHDVLNDQISFFRSAKHFETSRAKQGENPEILGLIRFLVKAFQYELNFTTDEKKLKELKSIAEEFNPQQLRNSVARYRMEETLKKLIMHSTNIEYAMNTLDELGLRRKFIDMGDKNMEGSASWWLNKEPLRSKPVGRSSGPTAEQLGLTVVSHATKSFLAYESIVRAHSGKPNVLISRWGFEGEKALRGDGFYTRIGKNGAEERETGLTIRFTVDPKARAGAASQGADFTVDEDYVIFHNKNALVVIPESLNFSLDDLLKMAESDKAFEVDKSDLALLEALKRKLNAAKISEELEALLNSKSEKDHEHLIELLITFQNSVVQELISSKTLSTVAENIYDKVKAFSNSKQESERIFYIKTVGPIFKLLHAAGVLDAAQFIKYLESLSAKPGVSFELRKTATFELLFAPEEFQVSVNLKKWFSESELILMQAEFYEGIDSKDIRKNKFVTSLQQRWTRAIERGEIYNLEEFIESGFFGVNYQSVSGQSLLLLASYYKQKTVIDWLIKNPEFDFSIKNKAGYNQIEQLQLAGKDDLANKVARARRDVPVRKFKVVEHNKDGSPIIDFVPIEPNSFVMGGEEKVLVTLTKPFEIMSVHTTRGVWWEVAEVLKEIFPNDYQELNSKPSKFEGVIIPMTKWEIRINKLSKFSEELKQKYFQDLNESAPLKFEGYDFPVDNISYSEVTKWIEGLNRLSKIDQDKIQLVLKALFPRHKFGDQYRLPTEAEFEFVMRNQGLASGKYSLGPSDEDLDASAWTEKNSGRQTHPVGLKKPIMVNGHPIYDIQGNIFSWVADWFAEKLVGGFDPQGPKSGNGSRLPCRILRGSFCKSKNEESYISKRKTTYYTNRYCDFGFRLVRSL